MSGRTTPRKFLPAGSATRASVDDMAPVADPAPVSPMSDITSLPASNIGHHAPPQRHDGDYSLTGMLPGRIDPEFDRVTRSYALPRYVIEALRMESVKTHRPIQDIVGDAIRAWLPPELISTCLEHERRK